MSNIITADHDANVEDIVMTNGMASVFLSVPLAQRRLPRPAQPWEQTSSTDGLRADRAMGPRHNVYLNNLSAEDAHCCLICNDEPL